jgi:hypothetical protein
MSVCDICSNPMPSNSKRFSAGEMKTAVAAGFRPPDNSLEKMGRIFSTMGLGLDDDAVLNNWIQKVKSDDTDWMLCTSCVKRLQDTLRSADPKGQCDFCKRYLYGDERIALFNETFIAKLEQVGAVIQPGRPSVRDDSGQMRWVACIDCHDTFINRLEQTLGG